ncbi:adrenodoxin-like protein 2, mitochondrial [Capsicum annuum]|uniref:adrenodoxin-like protein 2, mitochondrial n=1 Tax=Capsicum annuum TaxID=4072 RepID=UPI001FB07DC1|nr:adrenodoxin-like protein 2, mitochondrial [Capsicum annuum]
MIVDVCADHPSAFWNQKKHIVTLSYEDNFPENNIPTKFRPCQIIAELVEFCKKEIDNLLQKEKKPGVPRISVSFVDKDGEENHIKVHVGMFMLEVAHENNIELEGSCEVLLVCSTCHVIVIDVVYYNKLEDPIDVEYDMLDLDFGMTYIYILSRLVCQVIAIPELGRIWLALPVENETTVDGYKLKPY